MSELKAINAHGVRKDDGAYYDRKQADEYIAELDERHTTEITALEVSYRLQLDGLRYDKDAEIRRLKRALWIAREQTAIEKHNHFALCHNHSTDLYLCINGASIPTEKSTTMRLSSEWSMIWKRVVAKCRAKAKEYDNGLV